MFKSFRSFPNLFQTDDNVDAFYKKRRITGAFSNKIVTFSNKNPDIFCNKNVVAFCNDIYHIFK